MEFSSLVSFVLLQIEGFAPCMLFNNVRYKLQHTTPIVLTFIDLYGRLQCLFNNGKVGHYDFTPSEIDIRYFIRVYTFLFLQTELLVMYSKLLGCLAGVLTHGGFMVFNGLNFRLKRAQG